MLEFKNTSVNLPNGNSSKPFSLVIDKGDVVCFCGSHGTGKSEMLRAILGLEPISNGFITIDGELITTGSASYFRNMIAYIPQNLPHERIKVSELIQDVFSLHCNLIPRLDMRNLLSEWQFIGLDKALLNNTLDNIDNETLQLVFLSFLPSLNKEIILLDNISLTETVKSIISKLVSASKAEIIYTCEENNFECNKIINF